MTMRCECIRSERYQTFKVTLETWNVVSVDNWRFSMGNNSQSHLNATTIVAALFSSWKGHFAHFIWQSRREKENFSFDSAVKTTLLCLFYFSYLFTKPSWIEEQSKYRSAHEKEKSLTIYNAGKTTTTVFCYFHLRHSKKQQVSSSLCLLVCFSLSFSKQNCRCRLQR